MWKIFLLAYVWKEKLGLLFFLCLYFKSFLRNTVALGFCVAESQKKLFFSFPIQAMFHVPSTPSDFYHVPSFLLAKSNAFSSCFSSSLII